MVGPLELFYDLAVVVLVAQAAHHLAVHLTWRGLGEFAVVFTLVWIALNCPRTSAAASGFGSQVSMWLGPPHMNSTMTDFAGTRGESGSNDGVGTRARFANPADVAIGPGLGSRLDFRQSHHPEGVIPCVCGSV